MSKQYQDQMRSGGADNVFGKTEGALQQEKQVSQTDEKKFVNDASFKQDGGSADKVNQGSNKETLELEFFGKDGKSQGSYSFQKQNEEKPDTVRGENKVAEALSNSSLAGGDWDLVKMRLNGKNIVAFNADSPGLSGLVNLNEPGDVEEEDDWGVDLVDTPEDDFLDSEGLEDEPAATEPPAEGYKPVIESIQEEDYLRFGVDPERDKKKVKEKGPSLLQLLNPRLLRTSVEKYGFKFNAKRFYLFVFGGLGIAIAAGLLFQLDWYFIALIAALGVMCVPSIFLASLKGMYTAKQFHDVSDYMEQLLYSFRRKRKILTSLEDVAVAFDDDTGPMKDLVNKAIEYIRSADTSGDIYREAFAIIEKEYGNDRLRSIHNFLIAVENNGGNVENSVDLLLDERAMWDERVHLFQKEKNTIRRNITVSIVFSLVLCFAILFIFSVDTLAELQIPKNLLVQITSTSVILLNMLLFVKITNKFTQSWLIKESKQSNYQILKDYFYVVNYDPVKERKQTFIWTACTSLIWIAGLILDNMWLVVAGVLIALFCIFSSQISYSLAKKSTAKELQKAFPQWMMELALILQTDNVQVAISKTLSSAPVVLRPELELLVEKFEASPHSLKPYVDFLDGYDLSDIKSAMKMLYSVSANGTGNIDEQITDLIKKQNSLMDKAEKITNGDQLAGMTSVNMLPMLFCIVKSVADMTVLVFSLFSLMSI